MRRHRISRNEECLCGSGLKHKNCCLEYLKDPIDTKRTSAEIDNGNFELALKFCRADLTRYFIYVKSHTEPLLGLNPKMGNELLEIDIKALSEILDKLMYIISHSFEMDFITDLVRLGNIFDNSKWHNRILYYKTAWKYFVKDNKIDAGKTLSGLSYKEIQDLDFLQMYLDICSETMSFSQKQELIDKIINIEKKYSGKVQYIGLKGIEYFLIGDKGKAKEIYIELMEFVDSNLYKFTDSFDYYQLGKVLHFSGRLLTENNYLEKSIEYFLKASEIELMTNQGYSMINSQIGDVYFDLNNFNKALEYYFKSLDFFDNHISKIFIAQVFVERKEIQDAREFLDQLDFEALSKDNKVDYLFVSSKLVILKRDNERAKFTYKELKKLVFDSKYFSDLANEFITELLEMYQDFSSDDSFEPSRVRRVLGKLNNYLILQPKIAGIGFNFNNLIKDFINKKH